MSNALKRAARVVQTLIELLEDRGYDVSAIDRSKYADDTIGSRLRVSKSLEHYVLFDDVKSLSRPNDNIRVYYVYGRKTGKEDLDSLEYEENYRVILVYSEMSPKASEIVSNESSWIQAFAETELIINPCRHALYYQKHTPLTDDEYKRLLSHDVNFKPPTITVNDPVCRYLDLKPKQVVRIERMWGLNPTVYYRMVKNAPKQDKKDLKKK